MQEYEPTTTPPGSQDIDNSEETVILLKGKLCSLFDKIDKKEEPAEEDKVSNSAIYASKVRGIRIFSKTGFYGKNTVLRKKRKKTGLC